MTRSKHPRFVGPPQRLASSSVVNRLLQSAVLTILAASGSCGASTDPTSPEMGAGLSAAGGFSDGPAGHLQRGGASATVSGPEPAGGANAGGGIRAAGSSGQPTAEVAPPNAGGDGEAAREAGGDAEKADSDCSAELTGAPLLFSPTARGFGMNVVHSCGGSSSLGARIRSHGTEVWGELQKPDQRAADLAAWSFEGLRPGTEYEYEIVLGPGPLGSDLAEVGAGGEADGGEARDGNDARGTSLYAGTVVTQRGPGEPFTFALITDSHIGADLSFSNQGIPSVLSKVGSLVVAARPDFVVNLGDMLDFHQFGFNSPPPDSSVTRSAYVNYRTLLGDALGHAAHFPVIGNWEGENGDYTEEQMARSRSARLLYMTGPSHATYPEGGSSAGDYYAFTWGDALFVVLNVMSYTATAHLLDYDPGLADDWTLGEAQFAWLTDTLTNATARWRFLLIHHTVGGAAANAVESAYGRGGGQAAHVGEQAKVHQLMLDHGVQIFFYGHDHVFADMTVDGIHYTMPGNAGAPWMFGPDQTGYETSWLEPGWARVDVNPNRVHVQFIATDERLLYEYTLPPASSP